MREFSNVKSAEIVSNITLFSLRLLWEDGKISGVLFDREVGCALGEDDGGCVEGEDGAVGTAEGLHPSKIVLIFSTSRFILNSRLFSFSVFLDIFNFVWQGQSGEKDIFEGEGKYFSFKYSD